MRLGEQGLFCYDPIIMHELMLSEGIVRTVLATPGASRENLRAINIRVGALSSANVEALEFGMKLMLKQEGIEGTEVRITEEPARVRCSCGKEYASESMFDPCPGCGGYERDILEGTEVTVESIEVEDEERDEED